MKVNGGLEYEECMFQENVCIYLSLEAPLEIDVLEYSGSRVSIIVYVSLAMLSYIDAGIK